MHEPEQTGPGRDEPGGHAQASSERDPRGSVRHEGDSGAWSYRPASDHGLGEAERLRSVLREPGLVSTVVHRAASAALWVYLRGYHGLTVSGLEHLPARPPFVMVANHTSHLDALVLASVLPSALASVTYPISAGEVFFESMAHSAASSLFVNALPLWRQRVATHALEELRGRLAEGSVGYILFPEGGRSRDGKLGAFKPGVGRLVAGLSVPVVGCVIRGAFDALPPGSRLPRPRGVSVRIGQPRDFARVADDRGGWRRIADELREDVTRLEAC